MTLEAGSRDLIGGYAAQPRKVPEDAEIGERARGEDQLSVVFCVGRACHQGDRVSRAPNLRARVPGVRECDEEKRRRAQALRRADTDPRGGSRTDQDRVSQRAARPLLLA